MIHSAFVSLKHPDGRKHTLSVAVTEASPERALIAISKHVDEVIKHLDHVHGYSWHVDEVIKHLDHVHGYSWRVEELFLLDQTLVSLTS